MFFWILKKKSYTFHWVKKYFQYFSAWNFFVYLFQMPKNIFFLSYSHVLPQAGVPSHKNIFVRFSYNERYVSVFFIDEIFPTILFKRMKYIFDWFSHNERYFQCFSSMKFSMLCFSRQWNIYLFPFHIMKEFFHCFSLAMKKKFYIFQRMKIKFLYFSYSWIFFHTHENIIS